MKRKTLIFKSLTTGETWEHDSNDWVLSYCNFNSSIHPSRLRLGQELTVTDVNGDRINIRAVKVKNQGAPENI